MITLYRATGDPRGEEAEDTLRELCLAHEVVLVPAEGPRREGLPEGTALPALVDEGRVYQEPEAIRARLEELREFRDVWYKYGGDSCYCDGAGGIE